jgi:hypothetical protein
MKWLLLALALSSCDVYRDELTAKAQCATKLCAGGSRCVQIDEDSVACMQVCDATADCPYSLICCETSDGDVCGFAGQCEPVEE